MHCLLGATTVQDINLIKLALSKGVQRIFVGRGGDSLQRDWLELIQAEKKIRNQCIFGPCIVTFRKEGGG